MANALPHFPPFKIREDELSAGTRWKKWFQKFENLITALDITDENRKKALLVHYGGDEIFDLVDTFPAAKTSTYAALKTELESYFTPKVNTTFESFKLRKMNQLSSENVDQFHVRLRAQAALCSFADADREILAQMIEGVTSSKLRKKVLGDKITLSQFLSEARNEELTEAQTREIEKTDQACAITRSNKANTNKRSEKQNTPITSKAKQDSGRMCRNCGGIYPHPQTKRCPAKGKTCMACKKPNHFAKVCRSKPKAANVRQVEENESSDEDVFSIKSNKKVPTAIIQLDDHPVSCIVDTGASVNILTRETFTKLKKKPVLRPSSTAIFGYNSDQRLTVLGCFTTTVKHRQKNTTAKFFVVDGNSGSSNLLSGDTLEKLGLIKYLNQVNVPTDLYSGFGKIKDLKIKLHIDDQVPPKGQAHRRIPYHTRKDVEREIKRLEEADIIESVEGPTPWVSPIVIVPKKTGGVRLCVDMREANKAIKRERHPMPTIDDMIHNLNGAKFFSRIDLQQAFHQLELDQTKTVGLSQPSQPTSDCAVSKG
ncbi:Pol polyprotein [Plakobranchus ocellatus]|uniref:Pol polyprotein n=1 Tax=Plakobranchus ocellatus TaxID=259542 RepID=A0AAV3Y9Y5_9GAST|nr:Pol polyprotein [Plakobranchus ocellatus]